MFGEKNICVYIYIYVLYVYIGLYMNTVEVCYPTWARWVPKYFRVSGFGSGSG